VQQNQRPAEKTASNYLSPMITKFKLAIKQYYAFY